TSSIAQARRSRRAVSRVFAVVIPRGCRRAETLDQSAFILVPAPPGSACLRSAILDGSEHARGNRHAPPGAPGVPAQPPRTAAAGAGRPAALAASPDARAAS